MERNGKQVLASCFRIYICVRIVCLRSSLATEKLHYEDEFYEGSMVVKKELCVYGMLIIIIAQANKQK